METITIIKPSTLHNAGLGLFATDNVKKGDTIAYYSGWYVSRQEATTLMKMGDWTHTITNIATQAILLGARDNELSELYTDSESLGNHLAQFANAIAPSPPSPTMPGYKWLRYWWRLTQDERAAFDRDSDKLMTPTFCSYLDNNKANSKICYSQSKVYLVATFDIKAGAEVLCRYGATYWKRLNNCSFTDAGLAAAKCSWVKQYKHFIKDKRYDPNECRLPHPRLSVQLTTESSLYQCEVDVDAVNDLINWSKKKIPPPESFPRKKVSFKQYCTLSTTSAGLFDSDNKLIGYVGYFQKPVIVFSDDSVAIILTVRLVYESSEVFASEYTFEA